MKMWQHTSRCYQMYHPGKTDEYVYIIQKEEYVNSN